MAHVSLAEHPRGLIPKAAIQYSRRRFGEVVEPAMAAAHHSGVLVAMAALEIAAERGWNKLDPHLRWLAVQASAGQIGCSWCTDFGYYEGVQQGLDPQKVRQVPNWRETAVYDERERTVLEYSEAATGTPVTISEDLLQRLHTHFSEEEIVELASWVALENFRSRFNGGLGLKSQGFADRCELPGSVSSA